MATVTLKIDMGIEFTESDSPHLREKLYYYSYKMAETLQEAIDISEIMTGLTKVEQECGSD